MHNPVRRILAVDLLPRNVIVSNKPVTRLSDGWKREEKSFHSILLGLLYNKLTCRPGVLTIFTQSFVNYVNLEIVYMTL